MIYAHFVKQRDVYHQPLIPHLSTETTHRDKREYFCQPDKKLTKVNIQKTKQYLNTVLLYNMLAEYAVARELLNTYFFSLKYFDGLTLIDNELSELNINQGPFTQIVDEHIQNNNI